MYFCPECNFTFDITKNESDDDSKQKINLNEAIKLAKKNTNFNEYIIDTNKKELESSNNFKKLKSNLREQIKKNINKKPSNIIFKCLNCNNKSLINETIRLYHLDLTKDRSNILSKDDCKLLAKDPILPRTKDYTCKNVNCISHKKIELKESVFIKDKLTYKLNYICCACYTSWTLN